MKSIADTIKERVESSPDIAEELSHPIGSLTPRPDQVDTACSTIMWLADETDLGKVVECPTGAGKTMIAQMLIHWLVQNTNLKIAFLVSRRELLLQTKKAITRSFGRDFVVVTQGSRHETKEKARVRLYMQQTIASKKRNATDKHVLDSIEEADIVFVDECHQTHYGSFIDAVLETGGRLVGLSATPDDWRLLQWFEREKILGIPQIELESSDPRVLAEPVFLSYRNEDEMKRLVAEAEGEKAKAKVRFDLIRRTIVNEIQQAEMRIEDIRGVGGMPSWGRELRWLIKVGRISHAKLLAEHLCSHGIKSKAFVSGKNGGSKRQIDLIFDKKSEYRCAIVVHRFTIGFDHPGIQGLILTTESQYPAFVQSVGRVLRTGWPPKKEQAYILDMGGNWSLHGRKYMERRKSPDPLIPIKLERDPNEAMDEGSEGTGRPDAEALGDMVLITLPGAAKAGIVRMDRAVLLAYCAVEAHHWFEEMKYTRFKSIDAYQDKKTSMIKRAIASYWFITGQNIVPRGWTLADKRKCANGIIGNNAEASKIWHALAPMPEPLYKRLMRARRKFSRQKRAA